MMLAVLLIFALGVSAFDPTVYRNSRMLSESYTLYWNVDPVETETITIAMQVKTTGWVGFGLGEPTSGSMPGADIIVGMVRDGKAEITDRHAIDKIMPIVDDCQDWVLINGEENDGVTIIEASRKLNTKDNQDRPVMGGSVRIVYAYAATGLDVFDYHGPNRHGTAQVLFGANLPDPLSLLKNDPDISFF